MMLSQLDIHIENNELDLYFILYTKTNERQLIDLKSKGKTVNFSEQNIGEYLNDLGTKNS